MTCIWGVSGLGAQPGDGGLVRVPLKWESAEGAGGYRVEICDWEGKNLYRNEIKKTSVEVLLPPGKYKLRISSLNRFGTADTEADWMPLTVDKPKVPVILGVVPRQETADSEVRLTVQASQVDSQTEWRLVNRPGPKSWGARSAVQAPDGTWTLVFPGLEPGTYTLAAVNKQGRQGEFPQALTVVSRAKSPEALAPAFWVGAGGGLGLLFPAMDDWRRLGAEMDLCVGWNALRTPGFRFGLEALTGWIFARAHGQNLDQWTCSAWGWAGWAWTDNHGADLFAVSLPVGWQVTGPGLSAGRAGAPAVRLALTLGLSSWGAVEVDTGVLELGVPAFSYTDDGETLNQIKAGASPYILIPRIAYLWRF